MIECLAEYPTSLCLWATHCISKEEHAIDHFHDTFHFGTEVGVTWSVDDVNGVFFTVFRIDPLHREVFGLNRNAFFALEVHRVHGTFFYAFVFTVSAALREKAVDECGLAMINVCDDGDITDIFSVHEKKLKTRRG